MDQMSSIVDLITKGGFPTVLAIIIYGGLKKYWVFGWQFQELEADRDRWMQLAMGNLNLAQKATEKK